ncbi:MAG: GAF domain-containing protein [Chloroflexi bacterium]|nr:GAF domain-containing protein [Chloroflexota bacterium]
MEQVADQLSLALENAKLFNQNQDALSETDEQARRLRLLNEMSALLSKVTTLQEILDVTSRYIDRILKTDLSSISILNESGNDLEVYELHSEKGAISVDAQMPIEGTSIGKVMTENRLINNRNLEKETHLTDSKKLLDQGILSTLIAPLTVSGKTFGTLNVGSSQTDFFSKNDENLITNISTIISSTAENQQLFDAVQGALADSEEQGRRLKLLNEMSDQLSRAENMVEIGNIATSKTLDILQGSRASMLQINPGDKTAEVVAVAGEIPETPTGTRVDLIGPLNTAVEDKRVVINEDSEEGDLTSLHSTMVAPILSGGKVICVLIIGADKNFFYTTADENVITQITSLVASVLENKRLFSQIQLRSAQLQTSAQVSRLASGILDSADLLQQVVKIPALGRGDHYVGQLVRSELFRAGLVRLGKRG